MNAMPPNAERRMQARVSRAGQAFAALIAIGTVLSCAGCSDSGNGTVPPAVSGGAGVGASANAPIVATSLPLAAMTELIAGDAVTVAFPVPLEVDPPFWSPSADDVLSMQGAELIVTNGAGYEPWLAVASLPRSRVVNTTASMAGQLIELDEDVTHSHGPTGAHSHRGTASTTWIDFAMAAQQARAIADALAERHPAFKGDATATAAMRERASALGDQLRAMAQQTEGAGRALNGAPVIASHPVFEYLSRRANLNTRSVHWEPGEPPTAAQWKELDELRAKHPATIMLWEGPPLAETERLLAERGVRSVVFSPLGNADNREARAWLEAMQANVDRLTRAAQPAGGGEGR
jgi:zinc transport system substrate-binding protein